MATPLQLNTHSHNALLHTATPHLTSTLLHLLFLWALIQLDPSSFFWVLLLLRPETQTFVNQHVTFSPENLVIGLKPPSPSSWS